LSLWEFTWEERLDRFVTELGHHFPDNRVLTDEASKYAYGFDASIHFAKPDVVVLAETREEVLTVVNLANRYRIPLVPRGAGTGLCGHALAWYGGCILDLTRMNKIREISVENKWVRVEPGVVYADLNRALSPHGYAFPPEPGSGDVCTIGGMVATNASGSRALKYGATREHVLALEVILPNGTRVALGSSTLKRSAGYTLTHLMVGSEGTLGVITEVVLRIAPVPTHYATAVAAFDQIEKAGRAVERLVRLRTLPAAIEIMDRTCIEAVNRAMELGLPEVAGIVIVEFDGFSTDEAERPLEEAKRICQEEGVEQFEYTTDPQERARLWAGRKAVLPSLSRAVGGKYSTSLADDMIVPVSRVAEAVKRFAEIAKRYGVTIGTYGHAGDGNLHCKVIFDVKSPEAWQQAWKACWDVYRVCVDLGGDLSGEHGIGFTKAPFLRLRKPRELELMRAIKRLLDPNNIMNPGKLGLEEIPDTFLYKLRYPVKL